MIKGVNKKIIEINNPDSIYFEKAVFYLKPGVRELPSEVADAEINKYIERLGLETYDYQRKKLTMHRLVFTMAALLSAGGIAFVFLH